MAPVTLISSTDTILLAELFNALKSEQKKSNLCWLKIALRADTSGVEITASWIHNDEPQPGPREDYNRQLTYMVGFTSGFLKARRQ